MFPARDDMRGITRYILEREGDGEHAASVYLRIRASVNRLASFPSSGRAGRVQGTREVLVEGLPYIVIYRIQEGIVEVLRVFHTSRAPLQ